MSDMSVTEVRNYLNEFNRADRVREFEASSATVELAAKAWVWKKRESPRRYPSTGRTGAVSLW